MRTLANATVVSDRIELEPLSDNELSVIAAGSRVIGGGIGPTVSTIR